MTFLIHPCPKFKDDLAKPAMKLGHAWVVISHISYGCTCLCLIPTLHQYCIFQKIKRNGGTYLLTATPFVIVKRYHVNNFTALYYLFIPAIKFYSILFYSIPFYSMLCYAMLCYAMLCYAMIYIMKLISGLSYLKTNQFHFFHNPYIKNVYWYHPCHWSSLHSNNLTITRNWDNKNCC